MTESQLFQLKTPQAIIDKAYRTGQQPPPSMDVDDWADEYRFMNETTGEKWFTERVEVARGPMKAVTEPGVRTITAMCCTQILKTELLLNVAGYFMDLDPCPILIVQPKDDLARKFSNVRLTQMINSTPRLKRIFGDDKAKDSSNTTQHKDFPGGHVSIVSALSPSNLAMFAIRVVLLDEIDKYDQSSGKEGDPVDLAEERMSKYSSNSLSIRVCSPTTKHMSRIESSYEDSDKRKPYVKCTHCGHSQTLKWKNVTWDKDELGIGIYETAAYSCEGCGVLWSEYDRLQSLKEIDWLQTAEFSCRHCDHINKPSTWDPNDREKWNDIGHAVCEGCGIGTCPNSHAGFWVSKIYGPFRPLSDMVKLWLEAQGNIEKLKTFVNTQLAETFEDPGEQIEDIEWLMARREKYLADLPDEVGLLTAGIDTQNNRLEVEVIGWGLDEESWSICHKVIPGDPAQPDTWKQLDEFLRKPWQRNDGRYTFIAAAAIDMGGGHTQYVANYCRHRINNRIWPIRGIGGDGRPYPVWPKNPSRGGRIEIPFYNVGVDSAKNVVFSRLFIQDPGPGYCHFPDERPADWFKQLTAEKRLKKWKGARQIYVWDNPKKARNEAFDCRVYGYAALEGLKSMGWDLNKLVRTERLILLSKENKAQYEGSIQARKKKVKSKKAGRVVKSNFMSK